MFRVKRVLLCVYRQQCGTDPSSFTGGWQLDRQATGVPVTQLATPPVMAKDTTTFYFYKFVYLGA